MFPIIDRYVLRDLFGTFVAVAMILLLIVLSNRFVRYLGEVASGVLPAKTILALLGLKTVSYASLLLPLSMYLAILLTLGRMYRDSEIAALNACGVGTGRLYRPHFMAAVPLTALLVYMGLFLSPWSAELGYAMRAQAEKMSELATVNAGRFRESPSKELVFYVERVSPDQKEMKNVFIESWRRERPDLLTADTALQTVDEKTGERYLVLRDGYRYEGVPGAADFRIIRYQQQRVLLRPGESADVRYKRDATPTATLLRSRDPEDIAELQWRFSIPLSGLLLALLAVPLAHATPRQGRYGRLVLGVFIYITYVNLEGVAQVWVERGKTPAWIGVWWVHLLLVLLVIGLLVRQEGRFVLRRARPEAEPA